MTIVSSRRRARALLGASALSTLLGAGLMALPSIAAAQQADQNAIEEVIVTATKRDATIQDIPFSINAQTEKDIQRSGAVTLEDLSRNVAGLTIQNLGPGQSQVSVRGVSAGQVVRDQPGVKEQVGVYLDESVISLSLFTPDIDLFDLNRVETLRGPQGTLFGSGSVGGTIRYITNQPKLDVSEGTFEANANLVGGNAFGGHVKGAVNIPISDKIAMRAVGYLTQYGGFIDALKEGGKVDKNVNDGTRRGGRLSFYIEPNEQVNFTPRIVYQEIRAGGFNRQETFNLFANNNTTTRPKIQLGEREQYLLLDESFADNTLLADMTANFKFNAATLTSVTSFISRDITVSRDASALTGSVSVDLGFPAAAVLLPSNLRDTTDLEQFTQELRLASTGDGPLQWVIGGFYSKVDRVYNQRLPTPGYDVATDAKLGAGTSAAVANGFGKDSPYNAYLPYDIKQKAVFGELTYTTGKLTATAGGRYYDFSETRQFKSGGLFANGDNRTDKTSSDGFTPRFLLSYEASDTVTFNAQASKGFRLGGVNDPLNLPLCSAQDKAIFGGYQSYDDETLWNYEGGVKSRFGRVTLNAAAFYTDIKNLQTTLDAGSCSSRVVFNVPKAHTKGVEAELTARLANGLDIGLSGSLLEAEFDSTVKDGTGAVIGGIRDGNRLPSVPKFQVSFDVTYSKEVRPGVNGYLKASLQHVGNRFTQASDQENNPRSFVSGLAFGGATGTVPTVVNLQLPSYEIVNLSAGLEMPDGVDMTFYVNNLFDENALLSFDRERGGRARLGYAVGQPRTMGVTVRKSF
ncbi:MULTISPECIES: TonB-dependent receptor [unclassified Caulobacter]|uniref:TonB-dependent receptor n=1 Tax=unclassified Caulobacter TaxID=2648921 RepID=UPI0007861982|nr:MULTISPECIES: TonB-dependent receptor [unclassified Caulobacter]AZS19669.1 TonB-dependent receptor [Caulobacter sp. FWC26]